MLGTLTNLDKAIIRSLHKDSRKPLAEIAKEVRSTPNTVSRRLNKLIEEGILELSIDFYPAASNDVFSVFQIKLAPSVNRDELAKNILTK
ncbi:MAG: Lrp/AsnC family transcriptional regulator [Candidatus Heimdallarchaeaceae archaeon]